jgi:DNA replication factor GINS
MNLDELQSVQSRERQTDSLQQLRETFYQEAGRFIAQLREERARTAEEADDPFDAPEVQRLSDDIETAERTVEAIYERRIGKLVKQASLEAAGMAADASGLTAEEKEVFDRLVDTIETNRERVLDGVVAGEKAADDAPTDVAASAEGATAPDPAVDAVEDDSAREVGEPPETVTEPIHDRQSESASVSESASETVSAADAMGATEDGTGADGNPEPVEVPPGPEPPDGGAVSGDLGDGPAGDEAAVERTTLRITRDVGEIFGVDERAYDLSSEDVVTLPTPNAEALLERDAAERLD